MNEMKGQNQKPADKSSRERFLMHTTRHKLRVHKGHVAVADNEWDCSSVRNQYPRVNTGDAAKGGPTIAEPAELLLFLLVLVTAQLLF